DHGVDVEAASPDGLPRADEDRQATDKDDDATDRRLDREDAGAAQRASDGRLGHDCIGRTQADQDDGQEQAELQPPTNGAASGSGIGCCGGNGSWGADSARLALGARGRNLIHRYRVRDGGGGTHTITWGLWGLRVAIR